MSCLRFLGGVACAVLALSIAGGARALSPADRVGVEFQVNTYTIFPQENAALASDLAGNFVVAWSSYSQDGYREGVFGQRFASDGVPRGTEFQVNTHTEFRQTYPAVASDAAGNFVVVWASYPQDGYFDGVFGQRFASSGLPQGTEFQVNTYTPYNQANPAVASDSAGNFVVVWSSLEQDGDSAGVFGQRFASSGLPQGTEFHVNTYTPNNQNAPAVASDVAGNFVVAWASANQDGSANGVFGQRFASSGAPRGKEFQISTYTEDNQLAPAVASDGAGNFVVVWASRFQDDDSAYGVFGQRFASTGAPQGTEFQVNTYTTNNQRNPAVASDSAGNFAVLWASREQDGSDYGVFSQRYASSGVRLGTEFQVNTYTTIAQDVPAVAASSAGNFVVVWESDGQDGDSYGVFGQRISVPGASGAPSPVPALGWRALGLLALALAGFGARVLSRRRG